ncbi:MarR family winged helix-turn-helix transcriptional regulator [Allosphingosinicella deserti]|uniref:MarR family transcriptional regulator n=1 Tax=Allosphingosinicella deserti TaxID=2116704 RepID=A0A2P7QM87_9SPHN|nr:MarR family transcriptional regulator [Sphingomonas deserti]
MAATNDAPKPGSDAPTDASDNMPVQGGEIRSLSNFLCFAIYSANLAFGRAYKPVLDPIGLTYTQYIALVALAQEDGQTVGALGEKLFLESNTLTPILKKLESLGFLERRRDPADERQVRMTLTAAGRRLLETDPGVAVAEAAELGDELADLQRAVADLRDKLLRAGRKVA